VLLEAEVLIYEFIISVNVQWITLPQSSERKDREEVTKENLEASHSLFGRKVVRETSYVIQQYE